MSKRNETVEQTVQQLLKPSCLPYVREVRRILESDPDYLQFHSASVSLKLNELLSKSRLGDVNISEHEATRIVREAVVRLRSVEK